MREMMPPNENVDYSDPISRLGKFPVVNDTERIGDQSLPFPITLPEDLSNGQLSPRNSTHVEDDVYIPTQDPASNPAHNPAAYIPDPHTTYSSPHPTPNPKDRPIPALNETPIELPTVDDDSDEEIVMSSTAYPGQAWQPAGFEQWMSY